MFFRKTIEKRDLIDLIHRHFSNASVEIIDKSPDARDYQVQL